MAHLVPGRSPARDRATARAALLVFLALLFIGLGGVAARLAFHLATARPEDAGARWQSGTVKPLRAVRAATSSGARPPLPSSTGLSGVPDVSRWEALAGRIRDAVVRVTVPEGEASGFLVDPSGLVVTTCHGIQGQNPVVVQARGVEWPAQPVRVAPAWDLLLLQIDTSSPVSSEHPLPGPPFPVLPLADGMAAPPSLRAMALSAQQEPAYGVRPGILLEVGSPVDALPLLKLGMAIVPGDSGAPLLDVRGHVIGIVRARRVDSSHTPVVAYAVPSNYLFEGADALLRDQGKTVPLEAPFLWHQLHALANLGERMAPYGPVPASQAFVTASGYLAAVVEVPGEVSTFGDRILVDVTVTGEDNVLLVDAVAEGWTSDPALRPADEGAAVYFYFELEPEEYSGIMQARRVQVDVQCDSLPVHRRLPLVVE